METIGQEIRKKHRTAKNTRHLSIKTFFRKGTFQTVHRNFHEVVHRRVLSQQDPPQCPIINNTHYNAKFSRYYAWFFNINSTYSTFKN